MAAVFVFVSAIFGQIRPAHFAKHLGALLFAVPGTAPSFGAFSPSNAPGISCSVGSWGTKNDAFCGGIMFTFKPFRINTYIKCP
jgi:hypothetical protein